MATNDHTLTLHKAYHRRNLYAGAHPTTLPAEAARLTDNRALIAGDLRRNPTSWAGGVGNLRVLDVLIGDCLGALLTGPMMGGAL